MTFRHPIRGRTAAAAFTLLACGPALAHPGHDAGGLAAGLAHPFAGLDHLLAMVAVGAWAAVAARAARSPRTGDVAAARAAHGPTDLAAPLLAPVLFVAAMALAALLAMTALVAPSPVWLEPALAGSVVLTGLLLAMPQRLGAGVALSLIAAAGTLHGLAHGLEAPAGLAYAWGLGMVAGTALLHAAGLIAGRLALRLRTGLPVLAGTAIGVAGLAMLAGRL